MRHWFVYDVNGTLQEGATVSKRPITTKGIVNHNEGKKGNKTPQPNVRVYWAVRLRGVSRKPSVASLYLFQIKLQIGNHEHGSLDWFVQEANRCSEYWREKQIWAVNGEAIRPVVLRIERKHHQQMRRKGAVYVQKPH
jgi:hypothetical protein